MTINTSEFTDAINAVLPASDKVASFMAPLGASPLSTDITRLIWPVVGGPSLVGERGSKGGSTLSIDESLVTTGKLVWSVRYPEEMEWNDHGQELLLNIAKSFSNQIVPAFECVIAHATDPSTGAAAVSAKNITISKSLDHDAVQEPVTGGDIDAAIKTALANQWDADGVALAPSAYTTLAGLETAGGTTKYPGLLRRGMGNYLNFNAVVSPQVAQLGTFRGAPSGNVLAYVGPWSTIVRSLRAISTVVKDSGNPDKGATDLGDTNEKVLRTEFAFSYAVLDYSAFTTIKSS